MLSVVSSSVDAGVKLRPTQEELEELGPSFRQIWEEFYVGAPDKPVACLVPTAGLEHFSRSILENKFILCRDVQNSAPPGLKTFGIIFFMVGFL